MSSFTLIHGAGIGRGWFWHLVEAELRSLGHNTIAPTLCTGEESATLSNCADTVGVGHRPALSRPTEFATMLNASTQRTR